MEQPLPNNRYEESKRLNQVAMIVRVKDASKYIQAQKTASANKVLPESANQT